jgi:Ca2+-binding RTX toxin-like protein
MSVVMTMVSIRYALTFAATAGLVVGAQVWTGAPAQAAPTCGGLSATMVGTPGADTLVGTAKRDVIVAGGGNDRIYGRGGNDVVCGGTGNDMFAAEPSGDGSDWVSGGAGVDTVSYAARAAAVRVDLDGVADDGAVGEKDNALADVENITGGSAADTLIGNAGANTLTEGAGNGLLIGGDGNDMLLGGPGADRLNGLAGDLDLLVPGSGDDVVDGGIGTLDMVLFLDSPHPVTASLKTGKASGDGSDTITGSEGLFGSAKNDDLTGAVGLTLLMGWTGDDVLRGGGIGTQTLAGFMLSGSPVHVATGTATGEGTDTLVGIAGVVGTPFDDSYLGTAGADLFLGGAGADTADGAGGADILVGEDGRDVLIGADGRDTLLGGPGADRLEGGSGEDTASFALAPSGVTADLTTGVATEGATDTLVSIENLNGSPYADILSGDDRANRIVAGEGNDAVSTRGGDDYVDAGAGTDSVDGGAGTDICLSAESVLRCESTAGATPGAGSALAQLSLRATTLARELSPKVVDGSSPRSPHVDIPADAATSAVSAQVNAVGGWSMPNPSECWPPAVGPGYVIAQPPFMSPAYNDAGGRFPAQKVAFKATLVQVVNGQPVRVLEGPWWTGMAANSANNSGSTLLLALSNFGLLHFGGQTNFMQPLGAPLVALGEGQLLQPTNLGDYYLWYDLYWYPSSAWPYAGSSGMYVAMDLHHPLDYYRIGSYWDCPILR